MADFTGFYFDGVHSSTYHVLRISDGDRYKEGLFPEFEDHTIELVGGDGSLYGGTNYKQTEFTINIAFDSITEEDFKNIKKWLQPTKIKEFRFDERPYKAYWAKLRSRPVFEYVCFMEERKDGFLWEKQRVYKGEASLDFIAYNPFGYCNDNSTIMTENGLSVVDEGINWQALDTYAPFTIVDDNINEWGEVSGLKNSSQLENYNRFERYQKKIVYLGDFDGDKKVDADIVEKVQDIIDNKQNYTLMERFKADYDEDGDIDEDDKNAFEEIIGEDAPAKEYTSPTMSARLYNPGDFDADFQLFIDLSELNYAADIIDIGLNISLFLSKEDDEVENLETEGFVFSLKGLYKNSKILLNTKNHSLAVFYNGVKSLRYDLVKSTHWPKIPVGESTIKLQIGKDLGGKIPQIKYGYQYY